MADYTNTAAATIRFDLRIDTAITMDKWTTRDNFKVVQSGVESHTYPDKIMNEEQKERE